MLAHYLDEHEAVIVLTLDDGESVGQLMGPTTAFVPVEPANADFAAVVASEAPIGPPVTRGG